MFIGEAIISVFIGRAGKGCPGPIKGGGAPGKPLKELGGGGGAPGKLLNVFCMCCCIRCISDSICRIWKESKGW